MKILLIAGHGAGQPGACSNGYEEANLTREVVNILKPKLDKYATIDVYPMTHNCYGDLTNGTCKVNFANYDYVLEIHFNAGGGTGTEIFVTSKEEKTDVEQTIISELSKYYKNRGVKVTDFLVISEAKKKGTSSALLELCFIDNANDIATYVNKKDEIVQSIADGIVSGFRLTQFSEPVQVPSTGETVDQILHVGSKVQLNGIYKINEVSRKLNGVICRELVGTPPYKSYHYIDATPCIEVDKYGNKTKDQICDTSHYLKIPGTFTVLAIDKKTNSCKIKIGSREVWIYCKPCTEV